MSFKEIILPGSVIAQIYKDNLVETSIIKHQTPVLPAIHALSPGDYLGANLKNIILFVHYAEFEHLPEEHLPLLTKILSACKLKIADVAIINTAKQKATRENIRLLEPKLILVFGECNLNMAQGTETPYFTAVKTEGSFIITSPALEKFDTHYKDSKDLKNRLWLSLKQFFNL